MKGELKMASKKSLSNAFDKLAATALGIKDERDRLLKYCKDVATPSEVFVADIAALFSEEVDGDQPIDGSDAITTLVELILRARKIQAGKN
jgi:hypothetical protein